MKRYLGKIAGVAFLQLILLLPSCAIVWKIDDGMRSPELISSKIAVLYFEILRFPLVYLLYEFLADSKGMLAEFAQFIGFFAGFMLDALLYAIIIVTLWNWTSRKIMS